MTSESKHEPIAVIEDVLTARYSCRAFKSDPVPRATIERILLVAQHTASWCNSQPWQVIVTRGVETERFRDVLYAAASASRERVSDFPFPREYTGERLQRRRESGFQLYNALGIARGDKAAYERQRLENFKLFGAPHAAIITTAEELGLYGAVDCGGYVTAFMLAAQALGVATIAQASLAYRSDVVRKHFQLAPDRQVVCGISFGYADETHAANSYRTSRAPNADVVTFVGEPAA